MQTLKNRTRVHITRVRTTTRVPDGFTRTGTTRHGVRVRPETLPVFRAVYPVCNVSPGWVCLIIPQNPLKHASDPAVQHSHKYSHYLRTRYPGIALAFELRQYLHQHDEVEGIGQ